MGKTMAGVAAGLWLVVGAVGAAGAQPRPGVFEEAGRLVDSVTDQIRAFAAQIAEPGRPGLGGGGAVGRGGSMGPGGSPSPAERPLITMMLHHRTDLGLTDEQVSRLEQLRNSFARESIRREADIRVAELDLAEVLSQEPLDLPQAEAKIREAARLRTDLRIARLRTIEQGKAVLTPEQRVKLASLLGGMEPQRRGAAPADRGGARL
jgi:Spy/CpxP family protein refolding chaperone